MPTALITGGHSGIGFACASELISRFGWEVVLAGRSPDRMKAAAARLRSIPTARVATVCLDTSSLDSVRQAAATLTSRLETGELASLDAVLCNAGGRFDGPVRYSVDGNELTFATNCLGHFLLVDLLLERVGDGGRIIFTASGTHDPATMDGKMTGKVVEPDAVALSSAGKNGGEVISAGQRYSTSKLYNVLNAYELHHRLREAGRPIASVAFDPGFIPDTEFLRGMPGGAQWLMRTAAMRWFLGRIGVTMGELRSSGVSLARLAADPVFADCSGQYFQCNAGKFGEARSSDLSYDAHRAARLWNQMEALVRPRV